MASTKDVNISRPINIFLDGTNYNIWTKQMSIFFIGRRLWRFVTGDKTQPTKSERESLEEFDERLEILESTHCKILSWFINISVPSIQIFFPNFGMQNLLGVFWQIDAIALVVPLSNFSQRPSCISCIKNPVDPLLSFTLKLVVCGISSLMLIHLFTMINLLNYSQSIGISIVHPFYDAYLRRL